MPDNSVTSMPKLLVKGESRMVGGRANESECEREPERLNNESDRAAGERDEHWEREANKK